MSQKTIPRERLMGQNRGGEGKNNQYAGEFNDP